MIPNFQANSQTFRQRWANYLTIFVALIAFVGSFVLKSQVLNATGLFENSQEGLVARYPLNWLLDANKTEYVFRVQDPAALPFKTTLQISVVPIGSGAKTSDIPDLLNMSRALTLSSYQALAITPVKLPNGTQGIQMEYAYVANETNPFLQTVPIVVHGLDVIVLRGNEALILTYRADSQFFDQYHAYFDSFLRTLEIKT